MPSPERDGARDEDRARMRRPNAETKAGRVGSGVRELSTLQAVVPGVVCALMAMCGVLDSGSGPAGTRSMAGWRSTKSTRPRIRAEPARARARRRRIPTNARPHNPKRGRPNRRTAIPHEGGRAEEREEGRRPTPRPSARRPRPREGLSSLGAPMHGTDRSEATRTRR
jgi:hypothetical protein